MGYAPIGIPFVVVCGTQNKVSIVFRANGYDGNYGDESDPGPYPIPLNAPVEGNGQGDSHVLVVDKDNDLLYELYNASVNGDHWEVLPVQYSTLHQMRSGLMDGLLPMQPDSRFFQDS